MKPTENSYDLVVLGAGSGGVRAARIAAGHGARVAICESDRVGGTCVIRGCVPKKLMRYAADYADHLMDAQGYGWQVGEATLDWSALQAAQQNEVQRLNSIYENLLDGADVDLYRGFARFEDPHTIVVGEQRLVADKVLIATGGRPQVPAIPGADRGIVSDDIFELETQPKQLLIIGGGYIACEFAGIFQSLGTRVELLLRRDEVLRGFDQHMREQVTRAMEEKGIVLHRNVHIEAIEEGRDDAASHRVVLREGGELQADEILLATGRTPNVDGLNLEAVGVDTNLFNAVEVDEHSRSSVENIFAVGDVTDRIQLTPVALHEGHVFADREFGGMDRTLDHRMVPSAVFSEPEVAVVGFNEEQARKEFGPLAVYLSTFRPMVHTVSGRAVVTCMKMIVVKETDQVVGIHIAGLHAAEMLQGFAVAVKAGLSKAQYDATIGIHPTSAEELVTLRQTAYEVD